MTTSLGKDVVVVCVTVPLLSIAGDYNHHLTSTPRTAHTRAAADTVNTSHVSLELFDERPVNRGEIA